jgi:hypothetical protein
MSRTVAFVVVVLAIGTSLAAWSAIGAPGPLVGSTSTSNSVSTAEGSVDVHVSIGPLRPVCAVGNQGGPPPSSFSDPEVVITSPTGFRTLVQVNWTYDGCNISGSVQTTLPAGDYSLNLTLCPYMGCARSLPVSFAITSGQTSSIDVSIDTGIR